MIRWISRCLGRCSLRLRLILFVLVPLIGTGVALGVTVLAHLEREGEARMQQDVELIARVLRDPLARALERNREGSVEQALQSALRIGRVYGVYLYDEAGRMLATTGSETPDSEMQSSISRIVRVGERVGEYNEMAGRAVYSYFVPLKNAREETIGLLQITRRERDFREYMSRLRRQAGMYLLLGAGLMTGIVFAGYHSAVGRSLRNLQASMVRIENGEHEHRAASEGPREIGTLAGSLNRMVESLTRARREIEARRATEEALQRKLHRSEKLAALGQVAAGVAHELGTPLSLIDGRAQRLLRHSENGSSGGPLLREIRGQVRRMEQLIRQLLEFGRPSSHNRKRVHADAIAEMAARTVTEENVPDGATVELRGPRPGPELRADPFRVELALKNLLQNAVHATPRGRVVLSWSGSGTEVSFTVADDGPGIPPGMESVIFDPFVTTKRSSQGSGLGLCVVQQVAEEHGAKLTVGASKWGGAEFSLVFPAAKGAEASEELNKAALA